MNDQDKEDYGRLFSKYTEISENFSESGKSKHSSKKGNKKQSLLKSYLTLGGKYNNDNHKKKNNNFSVNTLMDSALNNLKEEIEPPITLYLSMVGHSFPPGTQVFMPMFEFSPKKEIFFPPTSLNQSLY